MIVRFAFVQKRLGASALQLQLRLFACLALLLPWLLSAASDSRQFIGWTDFDGFTPGTNEAGVLEWLSPRISCQPSDEFIASWNADIDADGWMHIELRAFRGRQTTEFYTLGLWSENPALHPRKSVRGQQDNDGDVDTDTLTLRKRADGFQFRTSLGPATNAARLKLLAVSLTDTRAEAKAHRPLRAAWGKSITAPERSQMAYPDGGAWCSPTTVSMLLGFWAAELGRPELNLDVPDVAHAVHDTTWGGTGNWTFNMAFAGSLPGLRGYVARFNDVRELEEWIEHGYPVGISVCYDRLRAKGRGPNGHLMMVVGFTQDGDVILHDPGTSRDIRRVFPRERLIDAWASSKNTVYLIYPEGTKLPPDRFGHWTLNTPSSRH